MFAAGGRPGAAAVGALAAQARSFILSLEPATHDDGDTGWVELLANGLTFDLTGLVPGAGEPVPEQGHTYGLDPDTRFDRAEAVTLVPGPHLAGGGRMIPVLRCLAWLGASLARLPGVQAVAWQSARTYCAPEYFRSGVIRWIEGGVFPGLGLTALVPTADGGIRSEGLQLFTGQELQLAPELVPDRAEGAKIALRLLNWLVENGRLTEPGSLLGPSGQILHLEPTGQQRIIKVTASS